MALNKSSNRSPWLMVGGIAAIAALIVGGMLLMQPAQIKLTLDPIAKQTIAEEETLTVKPVAHADGAPASSLTFGIIAGPPGATIDPKTGVFTWKTSEEDGPKTHKVELGVKTTGKQKAQAFQKFSIVVKEVNGAPVILEVGEQAVAAGETLKFLIRASDPDEPARPIEFRFGPSVPAGARLDPTTGSFEWTAPESSNEHDAVVDVVVAETSEKSPLQSKIQFKIHVTALTSAAARLAAALKDTGLPVEKVGADIPPGFNGSAKGYDIAGQNLDIIEYETPAAAEADLKEISKDGRTLFGQPAKWSKKTRIYRSEQLIVLWAGTDAKIQQALDKRLGPPAIIAEADAGEPMPETTTSKTAPGLSELGSIGESLADLHKEKKLLNKKEYPAIRKLFADQFAKQNATTLQPIFEGDGAALKKWFDAHPAEMEEFFTAIVAEDDLAKALAILIELHKKFARQFDDYFPLALATAVTWDKEAGVFEYGHQAQRTHATYPDDMLGAAENFQYFLDTEKLMQGRVQYVPWEFLTHMVNHRTPRKEREWALQNYGAKRVGFGKCYAEVPYDYEMLNTQSKVCKLDGKPYTLPNLLTLGGVCAQQADFAARVGKSIGVPAEYVTGAGRYGGLHAWVMWVELKQVTKSGIVFSLESHGRYFDDNYYVGNIPDPQTGKSITDRELELRLHAVGMDTVAYRQTNLIMSAYPLLRETMKWNANDEIILLNDVIEMCPGNEQAWHTVAHLARDGKIETASFRLMNGMFEKLFRTFANFPDFTWKVFDDLVAFQKNVKQRNKYFERLVQLYEVAGRPDLSCEARILLSDYLIEDGKTKEVLAGLAYTIKKFPEEGQFVPKLLDKLEVVAQNIKGSEQAVLQLYQELLPLIPQRRGKSPSDFYMQMLKRASDRFKSAGQLQQSQAFDAQLAKLKASK